MIIRDLVRKQSLFVGFAESSVLSLIWAPGEAMVPANVGTMWFRRLTQTSLTGQNRPVSRCPWRLRPDQAPARREERGGGNSRHTDDGERRRGRQTRECPVLPGTRPSGSEALPLALRLRL